MIAVPCLALFVVSAEPILEGHPVKGSQYEEISVLAATETPAAQQARAIWAMTAPDAKREAMITRHQVIDNSETSRLYYEVVNVPPVAQRDYVLHVTLRKDGNAFVIEYLSEDSPEFPPQDGKVRMGVRATCTVTPLANGGSQILYAMHTELGGEIPGWMVKEPQRRSVVESVKKMLTSGRSIIATR